MSRAPIFIELAIWYYTSPGDHPSILSEATGYMNTANEMCSLGLLDTCNSERRHYRSTEGLGVYVRALCEVRTPVRRWVIPEQED